MANEAHKGWDGKSRGGHTGYLIFVRVIRLLGIRGAYTLLAFVALYFIPFAPRATWAIWNYHRCRRGLSRMAAVVALYRHYYCFGQTLIDKIALRGGLANRYHFCFGEAFESFLALLEQGHGAVLIGAHVGCWEAGAGFFGQYGRKINIVMYDAEHQRIKELLDKEEMEEHAYSIIPVNEDPIEALLRMKVAVDRGELVCFNGDRYLDPNSAVEMELMGGRVKLPKGPFLIASKCRVPVIFYYAMREPKRTYRFHFTIASEGGRAEVPTLMQHYATSLETLMQHYPYQWFNFYSFWNE